MSHFRDFSATNDSSSPVRNIDSDAPAGLRHEFVDLVFHMAEYNSPPLSKKRMHRVICQSLGVSASGQPYGGFRYAAARDLANANWQRVYDVICRLWPEFLNVGLIDQYYQGVNRILAGYGVIWELTETGRLQRYLPAQAVTSHDWWDWELRHEPYVGYDVKADSQYFIFKIGNNGTTFIVSEFDIRID